MDGAVVIIIVQSMDQKSAISTVVIVENAISQTTDLITATATSHSNVLLVMGFVILESMIPLNVISIVMIATSKTLVFFK